ncbi:efflux RND transporter periplasmic adaptor subunit [Marinobacter orientalis]|uniref:Efflux RND transporter periplasmic adaptor subunit n=1 Tax=Marinobacter orientalis TaxID=1928859 RepID=A0A7Y0WTK5_9GAMM|nr:efflux RND transporter periplasmic adaptor subunit [Marinobacter orientalis]NMT65004.1 efflux RND transporter periplasmic adaptor subunit [Marinobacter orientalis]TGX48105.1 efflux RND transporter periplasmic adaptor subunit [Marinobacter orientalis]
MLFIKGSAYHNFSLVITAVLLCPGIALAEDQNEYDCLVDPAQVLDLASFSTGILDEVLVSRGDEVKKGQIVARVESSREKAALAIAEIRAENSATVTSRKAQYDYAQKQLIRAQGLKQKGAISSQRFDEYQANEIIAKQELELAKLELARLRLEQEAAKVVLKEREIRSPVDGVVQKVDRGAGEYVFQDASILTVVQLDPLFIETFVPVEFYGKVIPGMLAQVSFDKPDKVVLDAKVDVVDRVFDTGSRTMGVRLKLGNPDGKIPAGQRCRVSFSGIKQTL